jgi:hypothetical protein
MSHGVSPGFQEVDHLSCGKRKASERSRCTQNFSAEGSYPASHLSNLVSVEVTRNNIESKFSDLKLRIEDAEFVAVDLEFSGIGWGTRSPYVPMKVTYASIIQESISS